MAQPFVYRPEIRASVTKASYGNGLPKLEIPEIAPQPEGFIAYSTTDKSIYYSTGATWVHLVGQSIVVTAGPTYTVSSSDEFVFCNTSGGSIVVNLPAGTKGRQVVIADIGRSYGGSGAGTNAIQVNSHGTDQFIVNNGTTQASPLFLGQDGARVQLTFLDATTTGLSTGAWYSEANTTAAPINPVVYVSTPGSDNNTGLSPTQGVASIQQAINIISGIGWQNTGTIQLDANSYNVNNLVFQNSNFGIQKYPLTIQGTLVLTKTGTITNIAATYNSSGAPDTTGNPTYTVSVTSSSVNHALQGQYLQVTSSVGSANQVGYLIADNTNTGPTTETYQMCAFPSLNDPLLSGQPAPAIGDTFTVYTRGSTIAFTGSVNSQVNGSNPSSGIYFRNIRFTQTTSTNQQVIFGSGIYYFTNVALVTLQVSGSWFFGRSSRVVTGRSLISFNAIAGPCDVAGIFLFTSQTISSLRATGEGGNFAGCYVNNSQIVIDKAGSAAVNGCVFIDGALTVQGGSTCSSQYIVGISSALTPTKGSFLVANARLDLTNAYVIATAGPPNLSAGINVQNASSFSGTTITVTGFTGTRNNGILITRGSTAYMTGITGFANLWGLTVSFASSLELGGNNIFNQNTGSGIVVRGASRMYADNSGTLTCGGPGVGTGNTNYGMYIQSSTVHIYASTFTASRNGGVGVMVDASNCYIGDENTPSTNTISFNTGFGVTVINGSSAVLNGVTGTNNAGGVTITNSRVSVDPNTTVTGGGNDVVVGLNGATAWGNVNLAGSTSAHCIDFFDAQSPTSVSSCRVAIAVADP